jgi:uncharacterized protein YndB with AHSA1/START domain
MIVERAGAWTCASRVIRAQPEELYAAFLDPTALVDWLPPAEMMGEIHEFDARVGGGYRMSLFYPPGERAFRGKMSGSEDMVNVRFVELAPPRRIVEAVSFVTTDPAFFGEMTMIATFEEVSGGTEVELVLKNLPPGLRAEDNEAGSRLSLEQLAPPLRMTVAMMSSSDRARRAAPKYPGPRCDRHPRPARETGSPHRARPMPPCSVLR